MVKLPYAAVAMLLLASACGDPSHEERERVEHAVVGGEPSDSSQDGVLLLRGTLENASELVCTASLVAPNLVLTARHCVAYLSEGLFSCDSRGNLVPSDAEGGRLGLHLEPEVLTLYAGETPRRAPLARALKIFSTLSPTICTNDIAFVLLDRELDLPLLPMRLDAPALPGELGVLVGYGASGDELAVDYVSQPRLQRRNLRIAAVGPGSVSDGVATTPPRSLLLRGPSGCMGDSGGPLLSQESGAVIGVYSLQAGESCSAANAGQLLVQIFPFTQLVADAFEAAGAEPVPEPQLTASGGEGGQAPMPEIPTEAGVGGTPDVAEPTPQPTPPQSSGCSAAPPRGAPAGGWLFAAAVWLRARVRRRGALATAV